MTDPYSFALANEEDRDAVMAIYTACSYLPGCTWSQEYPSREEFDADTANGWLYCLKEGGDIIAVISIGDFGELGSIGIPWSVTHKPCEMARIGVAPRHVGKGVGTLVLNRAIDTARGLGFDGIRLLVSPQNQPAVAMYRRAGFKTVGETDMYARHWLCQELALSAYVV